MTTAADDRPGRNTKSPRRSIEQPDPLVFAAKSSSKQRRSAFQNRGAYNADDARKPLPLLNRGRPTGAGRSPLGTHILPRIFSDAALMIRPA
jgi:hypothetical protein